MRGGQVRKLDAAKRQINTAIRMYLSDEDPLAVHTIVMAALQLLRDLSQRDSAARIHRVLAKHIAPDTQLQFWARLKQASNFLKHADRDADAQLGEIDPDDNAHLIFLCCILMRELGTFSVEAAVFMPLHLAQFPEYGIEQLKNAGLAQVAAKFRALTAMGSRAERFAVALEAIRVAERDGFTIDLGG